MLMVTAVLTSEPPVSQNVDVDIVEQSHILLGWGVGGGGVF